MQQQQREEEAGIAEPVRLLAAFDRVLQLPLLGPTVITPNSHHHSSLFTKLNHMSINNKCIFTTYT